MIDDALIQCRFVKKVIVLYAHPHPVSMIKGRDVWWEDEMNMEKVRNHGQSGLSGRRNGCGRSVVYSIYIRINRKTKRCGAYLCGYMVYTNYTFVNVFQYQPGDIYFCTADIGWITGHSYIVYGPLSAGATTLLFEGIPTWPDAGRFWDIVDKYKVNILYTAPTAIRCLMGFGLDPLKGKDLASLQVLGTVGEPINEEAWHWYDEHIGKKKCPIVDTWWQTETGGSLISNLAGVTPQATYATLPLPGISLTGR